MLRIWKTVIKAGGGFIHENKIENYCMIIFFIYIHLSVPK